MNDSSRRFVLRDLSLDARLVVAAFLVSVGIGYFSALVQLHFQAASPGQLLPGPRESGIIYHGPKKVMSQLERILTANEKLPFNGSGSMRAAFTTRSTGWQHAIKEEAKKHKLDPKKKSDLLEAEKLLRAERDGEILILVDWVHSQLPEKAYEEDSYPLPAHLANQPITDKFVSEENSAKSAQIKTILETRCVRCHSEGKTGPAAQAPLESYEDVRDYSQVETAGAGMSLRKLAQTSHVHLLGFAMLYGLTGFIFCFTSYPIRVRLLLAPLALVAQVVEISVGWWGGRAYEPLATNALPVFAIIAAAALFCHIVGSLLNMFGAKGKAMVLLLLVASAVGVGALHTYVINPYLQDEQKGAVLEQSGDQ